MSRFDEDERPTKPTHIKPVSGETHSDLHYRMGQLMAESLNHRRRLETLEAALPYIESALQNQTVKGSIPPAGMGLFALARKTLISTLVIFAAIISALKELGFLGH